MNSTKNNIVYVPELDQGKSLQGAPCYSANLWIPLTKISNLAAVVETATIRQFNDRTGQETIISLAAQTKDHLVVARHLFPTWDLSEFITPKIPYETIGFKDFITPRSAEQEIAWEALDKASNGVLNLACGKGKTVLALKKIATRNFPAVVFVNNTALLNQWTDRAKEFLGLEKDQIGIVRQKQAEWDKPLVICMIQTVSKKAATIPMEIRQRFGTIIFDEVHHLSAATFIKTAPLFYGQRYGLTATPSREDGLEHAYYAHIGEIFYSDLVGELEASVYFKSLNTEVDLRHPEVVDIRGEFCVSKFYAYLAKMTSRNQKIIEEVKKAAKKGRKILALSHSVQHPNLLAEMAKKDNDLRSLKIGCVSGKTKGADRLKIIEESNVTFATFQVAKEGLDIVQLDTLFFLTPFKAWGSLQQGKGRIERNFPGKKDPVVIIFNDVAVGPSTAMCKSLMRSLRLHGFKFKRLD